MLVQEGSLFKMVDMRENATYTVDHPELRCSPPWGMLNSIPDGSIRPPRARGARAPPLLCHVWVGHHPALLQHRSRIGHEVAIFKPCLELHDPPKKQIVIFKKCIWNWKSLKKWKIRILKKQDSWSLGIVVVKIDDTWLLFPSWEYILPAITTSMPSTLFLKFPQVPVAPPILGPTFDRHEPQVP